MAVVAVVVLAKLPAVGLASWVAEGDTALAAIGPAKAPGAGIVVLSAGSAPPTGSAIDVAVLPVVVLGPPVVVVGIVGAAAHASLPLVLLSAGETLVLSPSVGWPLVEGGPGSLTFFALAPAPCRRVVSRTPFCPHPIQHHYTPAAPQPDDTLVPGCQLVGLVPIAAIRDPHALPFLAVVAAGAAVLLNCVSARVLSPNFPSSFVSPLGYPLGVGSLSARFLAALFAAKLLGLLSPGLFRVPFRIPIGSAGLEALFPFLPRKRASIDHA